MKDILESIYVDSLIASLSFGGDYFEIQKLNGVKEKLFQLDTIKKLLATIEKLYKEEQIPIIDFEQRKSILGVLSDIRFDYQFQNKQDREEIIDKINNCIILLNSITPAFDKAISPSDAEEQNAINLYILIREFIFFIVHFYLQDEDTFVNEAIPLFQLNPDLYACAIDTIMDNYPKLLVSLEFLKKTKTIGEKCMDYINEDPSILDNSLKNSTLSILNNINKSIKLK